MLHLIKMWLKAPSPLLANVYMHRFIKAFRKFSLDKKRGAVLVNYADDFVVLCKRDALGGLGTYALDCENRPGAE